MSRLERASECPNCGMRCDSATGIYESENAHPKVDDISICLYCQTLNRFDENLQLRAMSEDEINELDSSLRTRLFLAQIQAKHTLEEWEDRQSAARHYNN